MVCLPEMSRVRKGNVGSSRGDCGDGFGEPRAMAASIMGVRAWACMWWTPMIGVDQATALEKKGVGCIC